MNPEEILDAIRNGLITEDELNPQARKALEDYRSGKDVQDAEEDNARAGGLLTKTWDMAKDYHRGLAIGAGRVLPTAAVGAAGLMESLGLGGLMPEGYEETRDLLEQRRQETAPQSGAEDLGQMLGRGGGEVALAAALPGSLPARLAGEAAIFGSIAAVGPEESSLGGIGALIGNETMMRAAESKPLRVGVEAILGTLLEVPFAAMRRGGVAAMRSGGVPGRPPIVKGAVGIGGSNLDPETVAAIARNSGDKTKTIEILNILKRGSGEQIESLEMGFTAKRELADLVDEVPDAANIHERIRKIDSDLEHIEKAYPTWKEIPEVAGELHATRKELSDERLLLEGRRMTNEQAEALWKGTIEHEPSNELPFRTQATRWFHKFITDYQDEFHPVARLGKIPGLLPHQDPRVAAANLSGFTNEASDAVENGIHRPGYLGDDDLPVYLSDGLMDIIEESGDAKGLAYYLTAMREKNDLRPRGKGGWVDDRLIRAAEARAEANPKIKAGANKFYKLQDELLDLLEAEDVIPEGAADRIRANGNHYYAPFRPIDLSGVMDTGVKAGVTDPFKSIGEGAGRTIHDPLKSTLSQIYWVYNVVRRKRLHTTVANYANTPNSGVRKLTKEPEGLKAMDSNSAPVPDHLEGQVDAALSSGQDGLFVYKDNPELGVFKYLERNGETSWYEVPRDLAESLRQLPPEQHKTAQRLMSISGRGLRWGTIKEIVFQVRNLLKDTSGRSIMSPRITGIPVANVDQAASQAIGAGIGLVKESLRRAGADISGDAVAKLYRGSPGAFHNISGTLRNDLQRQLNTTEEIASKRLTAATGIRKIMRVIEEITEITEQVNRSAEFKSQYKWALDQGMSKLDAYEHASFEAGRITTNFRKKGRRMSYGFMKAFGNATAFWNPRIQGHARTAEFLKEHPERILTALGTLGAPAIGLYMLNAENADYWALSETERSLHVHIPLDGWIANRVGDHAAFSKVGSTTWLRIPMPHDIGILFGTLPVDIIKAFDPRNPSRDTSVTQVIDRVTPESFTSAVNGVLGLLPTTTIGKLGFELATNTSWSGHEIEPEFERTFNVDKSQRGRAEATEPAKWISDGIRGFLSPVQVDYSIRGALGRLPTELSRIGGNEESLAQRPGVSGFFRQGGGEYVSRVYDELESLKKRDDYAKLPETQRPALRPVNPLRPAEVNRMAALKFVADYAQDMREAIEALEAKGDSTTADAYRRTMEIYFRLAASDPGNRNRIVKRMNNDMFDMFAETLNNIDAQLGVK